MSKKLTKISIADANGELQELEIPNVPLKQVPTYSNEVASGDGLYITQDKKELYLNGNLMGVADESYPEIIRNGKRMPMPKVVYATDTYIGHPSKFPASSPIEKVIFTDIPEYYCINIIPTEVFIRKSDNNRTQKLTTLYLSPRPEDHYKYPNIKRIVWRNFEDSFLISLRGVFYNHKLLTSLDIKDLNTVKVTDFSGMFCGCESLTNLDVSNFNTANGTDFRSMFSGCKSLTNLDVSNFNTANGTDFSGMFSGCKSLTNLDVSNFNTANGTDFYAMFYNCTSLTSLDLSNFDTTKVNSFSLMFYNCTSLTSLDLSNFDTREKGESYSIFDRCPSLKTIKLGENFFRATNTSGIFFDCPWGTGDAESLKSLKDSLVINSYDRKANGLSTLTLQLSDATKKLLSEDDKKVISAKGYTIA